MWPATLLRACCFTTTTMVRSPKQALERGAALSDDGMEQAGMGVGVGDFKLDGQLGIVKTHFQDDTVALYLNNGKGSFRDMTTRSGLGVETRYVGWGVGVADFDNDGAPDIFWVTGNIYPEVEKKLPGSPYKTPRVLFRNLGDGRFEQLIGVAGPDLEVPHSSRGCAFGDFDNDGDVDIVVVNLNEPPSLLRNDVTGGHHWIKVKLEGVEVEPQRHRSARDCSLWRPSAGSGSAGSVVVSFGERPTSAFRPGRRRPRLTSTFAGLRELSRSSTASRLTA